MENIQTEINGKNCCFFQSGTKPEIILIQPADERGLEHIERQFIEIEGMVKRPFLLAAFGVKDWNGELSPWEAPAAFGDMAFGGRAEETLNFVTEQLLPCIRDRYDTVADKPMVIGGYSLAGLFSLWAVYKTDIFTGCAAASPSVWFPRWMEFAVSKKTSTKIIYLSLGDREEKTKNALMSRVGDNIRSMAEIYKESGITCTLEWNEGNHFKDAGLRTAKAFAWCVNLIKNQE